VSEGNVFAFVNTTISTIKSVAIEMLKQNKPVFFGCDVRKFSNTDLGVMDTDLYDYELGFNLSLKMTKAERLKVGNSSVGHAIVLTGVDLDGEGNPTKWRVENSWGKETGKENAGKEGYFLMTDKWFDEYGYQVVVGFDDAPKELVEVFKEGKPVVLEAWDAMVCNSLFWEDGADLRARWLVKTGVVLNIVF
jgi:bleomycin hydrolase